MACVRGETVRESPAHRLRHVCPKKDARARGYELFLKFRHQTRRLQRSLAGASSVALEARARGEVREARAERRRGRKPLRAVQGRVRGDGRAGRGRERAVPLAASANCENELGTITIASTTQPNEAAGLHKRPISLHKDLYCVNTEKPMKYGFYCVIQCGSLNHL